MKDAIVIIPTIGNDYLKNSTQSVIDQSYPTDCLVVADGPEYFQDAISKIYIGTDNGPTFTTNSFNTGGENNGYYGHRIYAAYPHLIPKKYKYILFLDEDNWLEPNHVQECVDLMKSGNNDFVFSLRNIYQDDEFVTKDNCESLGLYPVWNEMNRGYHVDTSSYCFKSDWLIHYSHIWHWGWGADRRFFQLIKNVNPRFDCTGKYTLNYRVGGNDGSVDAKFFEHGNNKMKQSFPKFFPWDKTKT